MSLRATFKGGILRGWSGGTLWGTIGSVAGRDDIAELESAYVKRFLFVCILAGAVCTGWWFWYRKPPVVLEYRTEPVERGRVVMTVRATGKVNAVSLVEVGTQVSGTISEILADFNDPVRAGQLIARIDPSLLQAQTEQAGANLQLARAGVLKARAVLDEARRTRDRNRVLAAKKLISESDMDTSEMQFRSADAGLAEADAKVAQAAAALRQAETNLKYTRILSPVDGVVISRKVDVGQTVAASFQTPTLFTIARDLTKMQIDASVDEADIGRVRERQDVEFSVDAYPDALFVGRVVQVRLAPTTAENVVTYTVVIHVDNPDFRLKPGMTANVSIITDRRHDVLKAPGAALRFVPPGAPGTSAREGARKGAALWILKDGKPERIPVVAGISDGLFVESVSGDVTRGQPVVVSATKPRKNATRSPF